jgi:hypothetical protein
MMPVVVLLAILVVIVVLATVAGRRDGDLPARLTAAAAGRLPAGQEDWGRAMVAELTDVNGRLQRWHFALGVLSVALFPAPRHGRRRAVVAAVGLAVTVAATALTAAEVPGMSVFVAVLGVLLCGYATVVASRWHTGRPSAVRTVMGLLGLAGIIATVVSVLTVATAHPTATSDPTHVYSVIFAVVVVGYLCLTLTPPVPSDRPNPTPWWALAAALASGIVWTVAAVFGTQSPDGILGYWWFGALATLAASIGTAATTRDRGAGIQAGLLTVVLAMPIKFAVDMLALLSIHNFTLTDPYDLAAFPHSGYPDVASYLLSDAIGGGIISGLVIYPIAMLALATLGAVATSGLRRPQSSPRS